MSSRPAPAATRRERRQAERAEAADRRVRGTDARRRPRLGLGAISLVAVLLGFAVVAFAMLTGSRAAPAPAAAVAVARLPGSVASSGMTLGGADAPVTIELYEDFQCPACRLWRERVFPSLLANEVADGTVRVVFRDMAFLGDESVVAGRAAAAAAEQGRFWDYWSTLYANQGHEENAGAFTTERLTSMASELGLDVDRFASSMRSPTADATLVETRAAAARLGIDSTPSLVVDGRVLPGVVPYADLSAVIAAAAGR